MELAIIALLALTAASTVTAEVGFVYVAGIKRAYDKGIWMPVEMKILALVLFIPGWIGDVCFNAIRGTVMFRELPKWTDSEWTFSARVQRHIDEQHLLESYEQSNDYRIALRWAILLNEFDKNHIRFPTKV